MSLPVAILAGGLATRLRPLTETIPKALVELAGKPFAVHQLELLRSHGIRRVVWCVGHLGEQVESSLGDGRRFGLELAYAYDGAQLLGTGGALRHALPLLGDRFFVLYGDSYLQCDYAGIALAFTESAKLGLMTVFKNEGNWDTSNVAYANGRILRYDKKRRGPEMRHIDYGLGAFKSAAFAPYPESGRLDLEKVYQDLVARDELAAFEVEQRFYEVGSPAGLEETRRLLEQRKEQA
jgi:NDP-sugar pyrophosphorylase family protein